MWRCPSAAALYLARAAQGVSAAFMLAPALAIIGHTFHQEEERNRAWAMWGAIMGLTMVLSPILGGVIAYALGWRWAFYINVPICIALALAALRLIEESRDMNARRLDPLASLHFQPRCLELRGVDQWAGSWMAIFRCTERICSG